TQERFGDVLERLEHEVLGGEPTIKGPRTVYIDVGNAIDLRSYQHEYKTAKKVALQKITDDLGGQISGMLDAMEQSRPKLFVD
ncbi:MAG: hypothetical protein IAF58_18935, partial [Leptolyngbya sp.]|nr:hypothetical protein [Candidatus Melainabacteria bacterium]